MKKFLFFSSLAFIALVFLPQRMMAEDCSFTPNLFPGQAAAPARVRAAEQDEPSVGGYVEAIKITPKASVPTDIDTVQQATDKVHKCIKAGQVLIIRGDKVYTVTGQEL